MGCDPMNYLQKQKLKKAIELREMQVELLNKRLEDAATELQFGIDGLNKLKTELYMMGMDGD